MQSTFEHKVYSPIDILSMQAAMMLLLQSKLFIAGTVAGIGGLCRWGCTQSLLPWSSWASWCPARAMLWGRRTSYALLQVSYASRCCESSACPVSICVLLLLRLHAACTAAPDCCRCNAKT